MSLGYKFVYILIGDSFTGKSALLLKFTDNIFNQDSYSRTVLMEYRTKNINVYNEMVKLIIYDTTNQELFKSTVHSYYKVAAAAIFVYDVTKRETFDNLNFWINETRENGINSYLSVLIGNKADLESERTVLFEEGAKFASDHLMYLETSVKTGFNVHKLFYFITVDLLGRKMIKAKIRQ